MDIENTNQNRSIARHKVGKAARGYVRGTSRLSKYVDRAAAFINPRHSEEESSAVGSARGPIRFGMWTTIVIFGVFGLWSAIAPLDSAAIAIGTVEPNDSVKPVQHLEGGIVEEVLVEEGDTVLEGDPLVRLSETEARARLDLLRGQYFAALAAEARLVAESTGKEQVSYPQELLDAMEAQSNRSLDTDSGQDGKAQQRVDAIFDIIESQDRLFEARRKAQAGKVSILNQRIEQLKQEIEGLSAQEKSVRRQSELIREEAAGVEKLYRQGNAQKTRLLALQRKEAELEGQRGEYLARISRAQQAITEAELEKSDLKNTLLNEVASELRDTKVLISDLSEKLRASIDVVDRIIITAPQTGKVKDLKALAKGNVIAPGEQIMLIVPDNDLMVIRAKVMPQDIDVVHEGLSAQVRLTAFRMRHIPMMQGQVVHVSADRFEDERTGNYYYEAKITVDQEQLADYSEINMYPGMPADVLVVTGSRTLLSYMLDPLTDSFHRAFREQ